MKKFVFSFLSIVILLNGFVPLPAQENWEDAFVFITTADMRYYATEKYRSSEHFLGVVEAIKDVGKGAFTISTGDIDPPYAVREVISQVLGNDYPWYPVPGNHEMEFEQDIQWIQKYNKNSLPNVVKFGPSGTEELTYSFDWGNCHFIVLNQYYDGKSINGTDGDIVPELMTWLENDLTASKKKFIFVFGHEPIVSVPDMDNGRIRHQGDSLDKYPKNAFRFHQLLLKHKVTAYFCGHTHSTSFAKINGLWQLDTGHSRGIEEDSEPMVLFDLVSKDIKKNKVDETGNRSLLQQYYNDNKKQVKKTIFYLRYYDVDSYKVITDDDAIEGFYKFYDEFSQGGESKQNIIDTFWENCEYRKSTFLKIYVTNEKVKAEIYRDDAHGGKYTWRQTIILD